MYIFFINYWLGERKRKSALKAMLKDSIFVVKIKHILIYSLICIHIQIIKAYHSNIIVDFCWFLNCRKSIANDLLITSIAKIVLQQTLKGRLLIIKSAAILKKQSVYRHAHLHNAFDLCKPIIV